MSIVAVAVVIVGGAIAAAIVPAAARRSVEFGGAPTRAGLDVGWLIQSSEAVEAQPEAVSRPGFSTAGWYPVTLPSTVLAGLVANHQYEHLYVGTNLQGVWEPRFEVPWWYRAEFELDDLPGAHTRLHFDGINYRADVYVNGKLIAGSDRVAGTFRTYSFDVADVVHPGTNAVAVRVYPVDAQHDLTITWIDWNPLAPDHGMGLWHDVWLTRTGMVTVRDPGHARVDVLRLLAAIVEMDDRGTGHRSSVRDVAGDPDAEPPERDHVHDRKRHQTRPGCAADVREGAARRTLAEPHPGLCVGRHVKRARADRGEDDRPVRLGSPGYWYDRRADGGAEGFNTETSAGQSIPELEDVRRMLTPDERNALWTEPRTPQYHAGVGNSVFKTFHIFERAMTARMGAPTSFADYVRKAQVMAYENERAMFEAFSRNRYGSTGVMLNNAWPSLHWNLFDWFLEPNGSTFGAKVANRPLHVQYSYDDRSVAVVNQTPDAATDLTVRAQVFDLHGEEPWSRSTQTDVGPDGVARLFRVPQPAHITSTYFVELTLSDANGLVVDRNVYWLSTAPERLGWSGSTWFFTPTKTYADFTALSDLPKVSPTVSACDDTSAATGTMRVRLTNDSGAVAFFVRVRLTAGLDGGDVTPVTWSDGYVTLMPGEEQTLTANYQVSDLHGAEPSVEVSGWNVPRSRPAIDDCG